MGHIHTNYGDHDFTASAFIIDLGDGEPKLLMHRHLKIGMWMFVGGHIELHENPWQALQREIREELGYDLGQLTLLQPPGVKMRASKDYIIHPWPVSFITVPYKGGRDHFHTDLAYAFTTTEKPKHTIDKGEVQEWRGFTAEELRALPEHEIPDDIRQTGCLIMEELLSTWQQMPAKDWK